MSWGEGGERDREQESAIPIQTRKCSANEEQAAFDGVNFFFLIKLLLHFGMVCFVPVLKRNNSLVLGSDPGQGRRHMPMAASSRVV